MNKPKRLLSRAILSALIPSSFLLGFLLLPLLSAGQSFVELCPASVTSGTVVDFESYDGTIYATGFFDQICGQNASYMAEWDGTGWVASSVSLSDPGHSLKTIDGKLYIARYEESIDSNWLLAYDGSSLAKQGVGVYLTTASGFSELPNIYDVAALQGDLIMCGEFDKVGADNIDGAATWDGSSWVAMGSGFTGSIPFSAPVIFPHRLMTNQSDTEVYAVGNFLNAGGVEVNGIAVWDGTAWSAMGEGFNGTVYGIGEYDGKLYAGGSFTGSGTEALNAIAVWDGAAWVSPGFGFVNASATDFTFVHTFEEIDGALFIGGGLKRIRYDSGVEVDCGGIVSWDGDTLNTFDGGIAGVDIEAIIEDTNGDILIGGGVFGSGYLGILENVSSGVEENPALISAVNIGPNPFSDQLYIDAETQLDFVTVTDLSGKIVWETPSREAVTADADNFTPVIKHHLFDLAHLENGLYIVTAWAGQSKLSKLVAKVN